MNIISLDVETTIHNKGNPFDSRNKLVCYSWADEKYSEAHLWDAENADWCQDQVDTSDLIVGFNFKFDYHWLANNGIDLSNAKIWDCQIAEFILSNQTNVMPSLNEACAKYGIPLKLDVCKTEYWDKGINTDEIPWPILREYAAHDAAVTLQVYHAQRKVMTPAQVKLCQLQCMDLHILRDMEHTGILFDEQLCDTRSEEVENKIKTITAALSAYYPNVPLNFGSNDHLSAFLYGGVVKEEGKEHIGFYKTGAKAGQPKYKNVIIEHTLPKMYTPLKGSEMQKEGMFSTSADTLKKLKGKKQVITMLLELAQLEKINGTYYKGLPKLRKEMHWEERTLHGQFNQCVAATGRLSSSKPNLQNFASELQDIFISRYG